MGCWAGLAFCELKGREAEEMWGGAGQAFCELKGREEEEVWGTAR